MTGEYDGSGQLIQEIIWLGDLPVAVLKSATNSAATPDIYYIHADPLGTPRKITRPNDNRVVWSWESEAFGNSLSDQNPSGLGDFVFNLRFPGQYYDSETGLHYNMARYYNPRIGGYDQSDRIGLRGGINTYAYVGGNPINWVDPTGQNTIIVGGIVIGGSVVIVGATMSPAGQKAINDAAKAAVQMCSDVVDKFRNWYSKEKDVPDTGPPGEWIDGERRSRKYGPDGKPQVDIDNPHQGMPDTHVHEWPDGVREHPGRPVPW